MIQNGSGTVTSPGFPYNYGTSESCTYTLNADAGKTIRITFSDSFDVEYCTSSRCSCDALTIAGIRYCGHGFGAGTTPMQTIDFDQESVVLTWTSDSSVGKPGFSFTWESVSTEKKKLYLNSCSRLVGKQQQPQQLLQQPQQRLRQ